MANIKALTPFSTAARYADSLPSWVGEYDGQRIAAYQVWEDLYWSQIGITTAEASEDDAIQMPVAKSLVEAIVRYLAVDWDIYIDTRYGTPETRELADNSVRDLFKRENVWSKFHSQKRWGLVRGDAIWHITADPTKPEGKRISIHALDPSSYFPITEPDNDDRVIGVHIADPILDTDGKSVIRRQTYRRLVDDAGNITVTNEIALFETDSWDDRDELLKKGPVKILAAEEAIPGITQIPVYRVPFSINTADPFGSSVLRGIERVLRGVDQTITDEDLAVALAGLGFFATDSTPPLDENGQETDWNIGPLRMLEMGKNAEGKAATVQRIAGVGSVEPSQTHARYLENGANRGASVPSIALGDVDTTVAESGIALFLRLSPLLAANSEREDVMLGVIDQMLYDIVGEWFPAFESEIGDFSDVLVSSVVGDPMPTNRDAKIAEILSLATSTPPLMTIDEARFELGKLGYSFGTGGSNAILGQIQRQAAAVDPYAARLADEAQRATETAGGAPAASVTPSAAPVAPVAA